MSVFYIIDRKIYKVTGTKAYISSGIFVLSLLEVLRYEFSNVLLQKFQDSILFFLPTIILAFFNHFLSWNLDKRIIKFFYGLSTFYIILALTNDFHKLIWRGLEKSQVYNGSYKLIHGLAFNILSVLAILVFIGIIWKVLKTSSLSKITRLEISSVIFVSTFVFFLSLYLGESYSEMLFVVALSIFVIELLLVKLSWKKLAYEALLLNFANSDNPIIVLDSDNSIIDLNASSSKLLGIELSDLKKVKGKVNSFVEEILSKKEEIITINERHYYVTVQKSDDYKTVILNDITSEIATKQVAQQFTSLFNSLFENVPDGVVIIKKDGVIVDCNDQFMRIFGYTKEELIGRTTDELIVPKNLADEPKRLRELAIEQKMVRVETTRKTKDGKEIDVRITVAKIEKVTPRLFGPEFGTESELLYAFYTDITLEKEAINITKSLVQRDTLTGLYTRNYFLRKLASLTEFSAVDDYHVLIFIDISNFSNFNLLKGHNAGDEFLKKVAQRLRKTLREGDTVARPYADEFWVLIEKAGKSYQSSKAVAETVLSKILQELSKPYVIDGINSDDNEPYEAKFYVGIHVFSILDSSEEVIRKANVALSKSKNSQDRVVFYNILIDNELQEKAIKERALKTAFYNGELKIFLQPISNYSGRIIGAEALLRWVKKDGTVLPPYEFIEILEENGMIIPAGEEVLRQVCEFINVTEGKIAFVDVNVSPVQLMDSTLGKRFTEIAKAHNINSSKIVLEFTENILIDMNDDVKKNIESLLSSGFELCLDDFGAGYSSLSYLTMLPIRKIKIDRSFVFNIPENRRSIKLLEAIHNIARSFNLEAIPEGVENEKQLEILSMIGYRLFQGFLFGKPLPVDEFIKRFTNS